MPVRVDRKIGSEGLSGHHETWNTSQAKVFRKEGGFNQCLHTMQSSFSICCTKIGFTSEFPILSFLFHVWAPLGRGPEKAPWWAPESTGGTGAIRWRRTMWPLLALGAYYNLLAKNSSFYSLMPNSRCSTFYSWPSSTSRALLS